MDKNSGMHLTPVETVMHVGLALVVLASIVVLSGWTQVLMVLA